MEKKYIDSEKLIAEIYKCREDALSVVDIDKANNLIEVIELIEDLQQEQPLTTEKVVEQCKKFCGNPEVIQPEVDLEKEFSFWWLKEKAYDYQASMLYEKYSIISMKLARHFYELGLNARNEE